MAAALPASYKPIGHYLKIAQEHASRDPAIYYWCKYYALQQAMVIDKKSPDCVKFLTATLAELENLKKSNRDNEAITNDVVGQAHIEQCALKIFIFADNQDRNAIFNKNVVKAFYTAGHLFDILDLFGELDEKIAENRKYAKWKAAYIHNCLKNGETPVPGPLATGENNDFEETLLNVPSGGGPGVTAGGQPPNIGFFPQIPPASSSAGGVGPSSSAPVIAAPSNADYSTGALKMDVYVKAQKLCKQAASALDYEDEKTAIETLKKALQLLQTGSG